MTWEMIWTLAAAIGIPVLLALISNVSLFFWARSESREDYRNTMALIASIQHEIKDFHGRLCAIEERQRK